LFMYVMEICNIRQSSIPYLVTWSVTSSSGRLWRYVEKSRGLISDTVPTCAWRDWKRKTWQTPDGLWSRTEPATSRLHCMPVTVSTKVKQSLYKSGQALKAPRISRQSAYEGRKFVSPTHQSPFPPKRHFC
jgi:hypothetical protein